jgi:hypothetical protein
MLSNVDRQVGVFRGLGLIVVAVLVHAAAVTLRLRPPGRWVRYDEGRIRVLAQTEKPAWFDQAEAPAAAS